MRYRHRKYETLSPRLPVRFPFLESSAVTSVSTSVTCS
ncbi:hypothetical protein [Enterobacter phage 02_vB_Eclo_IJM]|nr:hypothetical protein [Enterobacter phage 02_vB_Eclo_IJM]